MTMRLLTHDGTDPGINLALEDVLLEELTVEDGCFWFWIDGSSVILGRNQILEDEVDVSYAREHGIPVYRRRTGGGAVFHDRGVLNFSFIVPAICPSEVCLEIVMSILDLPTTKTERNDVLWQGRKIAGTAQRLVGPRRLFHGSLLYAADLEQLSRLLTPPREKLRRHGVASVRSRVGNFGPVNSMSIDRFRLLLTERLSIRFGVEAVPMPLPILTEAQRRRIKPLLQGMEGRGA